MSAHVQTVFDGGSSVTSASVTLTTTAGNAVIVHVLLYFTDGITQTAGDTTTEHYRRTTGGLIVSCQSNLNVAGGSTTFTYTFASNIAGLFVTEVSGLLTAAAFDQSSLGASQVGQTTFPTGATGTTTQADEFLIAILNLDGGGTNSGLTASDSFTVPANGDQIGAGTQMRSALAYKTVAATGAYSMSFGTTNGSDGCATLGTFKNAAGATTHYLFRGS